jgi:hypothetical protein
VKKLVMVAVSILFTAGVTVPAFAAEQTFAAAQKECPVRSWEMTWGFKESFRSYLSGTIARGGWDTAGNITYDTPTFFLTGSSGFVNPEGDRGEISGFGRIDFTGHDGFLNQRVSAPRLVIESSSRAGLYFAVSGDTQEGVSVEEVSVRFAEVTIRRYSVDPGAGLWAVLGAPVVLTEEGSAAFGTYPAGEMLDPMDLVIRVAPGCLERDNLVALWLVGGGGVFALSVISVLVWRRVQERR